MKKKRLFHTHKIGIPSTKNAIQQANYAIQHTKDVIQQPKHILQQTKYVIPRVVAESMRPCDFTQGDRRLRAEAQK